MRLLGNRLLLEPIKPRLKTDSGLHLVEGYQDDRKQHKVLAVGPGKRKDDGSIVPPEIQAGDHVLVELYTGQLHTFDDGKMIINANDVVAYWRAEQPANDAHPD